MKKANSFYERAARTRASLRKTIGWFRPSQQRKRPPLRGQAKRRFLLAAVGFSVLSILLIKKYQPRADKAKPLTLKDRTMTTLKQKLDAGQNGTLLIVGDSRSRAEPGRWPQLLMWLIAGYYSASALRVVLVERNVPGQGTVTTVVQAGAGAGGQVFTVIVDSIPGATTYRADQRATIGAEFCDEMIVLLGVNDSVSYYVNGYASYGPTYAYVNLKSLCDWMTQTHGCGVSVMSEAWNGTEIWQPGKGLSFYRDAARRLCSLRGHKLIDVGALFDNHCNGVGFAEQDGWFNSPDSVHWTAAAEAPIAALCLPALGF